MMLSKCSPPANCSPPTNCSQTMNFYESMHKIHTLHPPYNTLTTSAATKLINKHIDMDLIDSESSFDAEDGWPTRVKKYYLGEIYVPEYTKDTVLENSGSFEDSGSFDLCGSSKEILNQQLQPTEFNEKYSNVIQSLEKLDSGKKYLVQMHLSLNPYKNMDFDKAIDAIKLHLNI